MVESVMFKRLKYAPLLVFEIILVVLYICFTDYGGDRDFTILGFGETHVMIFIGFAYLMTFPKKYSYSALGYNWLLAALAIQWGLLCQNFFHMHDDGKILITKKIILEADIMAATVLITFGALLGLASGLQLLFISVIEVLVGCCNFYLNEEIYKIADVGGSISIHSFGAYFGLGVSIALRLKKPKLAHPPPRDAPPRLDGPSYISDVTATLGSIFLWIYWPYFNSALTSSNVEYQRAFVNTYLSLASCAVTTFVLSAAVNHDPGKLDMVHIQNSTLAGGVGVGAVANLFIGPGVAIAVGIGAAFISVLGYRFFTPLLEKLRVQDTCGVNNLHGMPGLYSGLLSVLFAALATSENYGAELSAIYPATGSEEGNEPRTMKTQALYQLASVVSTLAVGLGAGFVTGLIAKLKIFEPLDERDRYDDEKNWELPKVNIL